MHYGMKPGGDASEAKSNVCHPDTYIVLSDVCKWHRGTSFVLVIIISSFSSVSISFELF